jgi:N-acetylglutamate synthase-like GNAT family acetyltransferase
VISIRDAVINDVPVLVAFDPVVFRGDDTRAIWIRDHVRAGIVRVAELDTEVVGYCAVEKTFFQQGFVELVIVAERARRKGVGTNLLRRFETMSDDETVDFHGFLESADAADPSEARMAVCRDRIRA